MVLRSISTLLFLCSTWLTHAAPTQPPAASFYVDLAKLPNFQRNPSAAPLHMWAGHLLAEPTNFVPPGPNETPHPNLEVQSHLYFVLTKARRASDRERTIWWFNGGPGCSSFDGLMMEVGPWRMNRNGELREVEGGWEEYANIVYIDQPVGTGFSYGSTDKYIKELKDIPAQILEFMRNFYQVFPELAGTDTYLAGESYAGQYIPYIADALLKPSANVPAPLKGIAIGNGWIDPRNQYPAYREFALRANLFTENSDADLYAKEAMDKCQRELDAVTEVQEPPSTPQCEDVMGAVLHSFTKKVDGTKMCMNVYDIRLTDTWPSCGMSWPPDLAQVTPWLRKTSVVNALHASHKDTAWTECSGPVGAKMVNKHSEASIKLLPGIADKIPVMLFAGDQDVICNYVGQEMLLEKMKWRGAVGMQNAPMLQWTVNGTAAGTWQTARNLTYVKIFQASHMVGFDLPHVAHDMMLRFMGTDFSRIHEGTAGRIESSINGTEKQSITPGTGNSTLSDIEQKAKWQAYYNAGTVALIVVLIAVFIGTLLYCRFRRQGSTSRGRGAYTSANGGHPGGGDDEESIPLNPSRVAGDEALEESRRRKGKGRAMPQPEETMFEIGSDGEEKYPS